MGNFKPRNVPHEQGYGCSSLLSIRRILNSLKSIGRTTTNSQRGGTQHGEKSIITENSLALRQDVRLSLAKRLRPRRSPKLVAEPSGLLRWEDLLVKAKDTIWWDQTESAKEQDEKLAKRLNASFGLNYVCGTPTITEHGSCCTVCLCKEGVFSFSEDLDSALWISDTIEGAWEYVKGRQGPKGETKGYGMYFK